MARKRRRSSGAGAGGLGPFGIFLALVAIGVLIKYWWVLLIVLGVVGLTVAIVRLFRTPALPVMAGQPKPARPLEPPPVMTPRSPALASEDLAAQMRANKQVRHLRDMQEWDYEWNRLLDSGSDQPAEGVGMRPEHYHSVKGESSNEHVSSDLDDGVPRVGVKEGQHHPLPGAGEDAVAPKRIPSNTDHTAQAEPGELLASDPRTMWAWADCLEGRLALPVSHEDARQVLAAIPPGDHVEIFGAVAIGAGLLWDKDMLPDEARFAARTFDRWILPNPGRLAEIIPASSTRHYATVRPVDVARWMAQSSFALSDGRRLRACSDRIRVDRFDEGAGLSILRLPDNPNAPVPPGLGTGGEDALVADYIESVTHRVRKAQANYGAGDARLALHEIYGENKNRLSRAENYLKGAVEDIKRHPQIGAETPKALVSHFRNADLKAAFFCLALGLPYPGDKPLSSARKPRPTAADFY